MKKRIGIIALIILCMALSACKPIGEIDEGTVPTSPTSMEQGNNTQTSDTMGERETSGTESTKEDVPETSAPQQSTESENNGTMGETKPTETNPLDTEPTETEPDETEPEIEDDSRDDELPIG